jgi:ribosome-associated protein
MAVAGVGGQHSNPFGDLRINASLHVPAAALRWNFSRSSGPGGQGVNTADSRVELSVHLPSLQNWPEQVLATAIERLSGRLVDGTLTVTASEHRAQLRNRQAARVRLEALLRAAVAPPGPPRRPTRPGAGARQRRLDAKKHRSEIKRGRRNWTD